MSILLAAPFVAGRALAQATRLRFAHPHPDSDSWNTAAKLFTEQLRERTGGALAVQVFGNGALGSDPTTIAAARGGTVELRIRDVKPGDYAVAVFQDLNGNGRIDRPFFIPAEPYGFSNVAGRRGLPRFEAAKVSVRKPATTVVIPLR